MVKVVCISYLFCNIDQKKISDVFRENGWGTVKRVDIHARTPRPGQRKHNIAFINFFEDVLVEHDNTELEGGYTIRVPYDGEYYWNVKKFFSKKKQVVHPQVKKPPNAWEQTPMCVPIWCPIGPRCVCRHPTHLPGSQTHKVYIHGEFQGDRKLIDIIPDAFGPLAHKWRQQEIAEINSASEREFEQQIKPTK